VRYDENGSLIDPLTIIGICLIALATVAVFTGLMNWVRVRNAPCGVEGKIVEISDCAKMIIKPDCSSATFNACADPDGDGIPEGEFTSDWTKSENWIDLIIIGAVAVGGVFILYKLLDIYGKRQPSYRSYYSGKPAPNKKPHSQSKYEFTYQ